MNVQSEINEHVSKLSPHLQERVLLFVCSLEPSARQGESGSALARFAGSLDGLSAGEMTQAIEEECERVDVGQW